MITLQDIELQRGTKLLVTKANATFYNKQKIGIVGKNGCGKTSLFLLLQNKLEPLTGNVLITKNLRIVTIEQEIPQSDKSSLEYVIDADTALRDCQHKLTMAEINNDGFKIAQLYETLQNLDGFTAEARAAKILDGLGFSILEITTAVNTLSGGWRMRLNIARALFVPSDILLLDEPTNHLDLDSVIWLEKWLKQYPGLLMFISHDREFLDELANKIVHIENKKLNLYSGNYSTFEKQRVLDLAQQQQQYEKQQQQIQHMQAFIQRFKAKATKARQAQSRIKALARMQEIMPAHIDSPFSFSFKTPKHLANPLLTLEKVSFAYTKNTVLDNINLQLNTQDRIALLGRNGAGKSTLIKLLAQELKPINGEITSNKKLQIGYFAQHTLDRLNKNKSPLQNLQLIAPDKTPTELRKFLGGFNFCGDMALMPAKNLSGGEKARLALALIVWQSPNVLLLDEPTNHLDLDMRQALIIALQNYDGAVVIVSHDRFLLKQIIDDYWLVADKKLQPFKDDLDDYKSYLFSKKNVDIKKAPIKKTKPKNLQKQLETLERKIEKQQKAIAELEQTIAELSANPTENLNKLQKLSAERTKLIQQCEKYEKEWVLLQE
ncbi:MAG: ATP-binding cassette domain-containing protein [Gammaproteobacteria bacterium]|jgi:ATP-binding cassette subfamily F protein 3